MAKTDETTTSTAINDPKEQEGVEPIGDTEGLPTDGPIGDTEAANTEADGGTPTNSAPDAPPPSEFVSDKLTTTEDVNLREEPSTKADVIKVLKGSTEVKVIAKEGDWYKVKGGGYVKAEYAR